MNQRIQTPCTACLLHKTAHTVGMVGHSNPTARLKIFLDSPSTEDDMRHKFGESRQSRFLLWLIKRNSLPLDKIEISFTLKCFVPKNTLKKKEDKLTLIDACEPLRIASLQKGDTVLTMGELSCLAFTGDSLDKRINTDAKCGHFYRVFVTYAPGFAIKSPSESVGISRMLWNASVHAGMKPKVDLKVQQYDYEVI